MRGGTCEKRSSNRGKWANNSSLFETNRIVDLIYVSIAARALALLRTWSRPRGGPKWDIWYLMYVA
jgi:hypothetical protein